MSVIGWRRAIAKGLHMVEDNGDGTGSLQTIAGGAGGDLIGWRRAQALGLKLVQDNGDGTGALLTTPQAGSADVSSFNGRTGAVVPIQADYDGFFLTSAEGNATYQPIGSFTAGSVLFSGGGSTIAQDNANLFYDDATNQLRLGSSLRVPTNVIGGGTGGFIEFGAGSAKLFSPAANSIATTGFFEAERASATDLAFVGWVLGDTTTRSLHRANGTWEMGDGGAGGRDVIISRIAADSWGSTTDDFYARRLEVEPPTLTSSFLGSRILGAGVRPFSIRADGVISWSDGTNAADVVLSRGGADLLNLASGDSFNIVSGSLFISDVQMSRGAANRLDLASGDSLNLVSGSIFVAATKVIGAQGAAVPDAAGGTIVDIEARAALNALLARLRAATGHGLIA